jgi:hypothetical protein
VDHQVVLLSLDEGTGCGGDGCGCDSGRAAPRVPVLACGDALTGAGARVEVVTAGSDQEIDDVIARLDGPARADGLTWPAEAGPRLVVAAAADGQLRAVLRRMVRRYAPPPSRRPDELAGDRTVPDLPPIGVLPLYPSGLLGLPGRLGLPTDPADVAKAVLHGSAARLDLLRNDAGSVTLDGALIGGSAPWAGLVEVDDAVLATPTEQVLACAVANADGYATVDGLPLTPGADPTDGVVNVAVAVPVVGRSRWGRREIRVEVRRARGRAVAVTPAADVPFVDDGVNGVLGRKRSWWTERAAWSVFRP